MKPKEIGELSEIVVMAALVKAGLQVLRPYGDSARYDFVVDHNDVFIRLQCKTGMLKVQSKYSEVVIFTVASKSPFSNKRCTYVGQIDYFIVYCPQNEQIYVVPITETKRCEVTLVIKSGNNNQHEPKQASDYTLERWLSKLAL